MKISAQNQLKGKILDLSKGSTTTYLSIDIGHGHIIHSVITNEAVEKLNLKVGDEAYAVIKASSVMVGID